MENSDFWYMDDGPLSRLLCEDVQDNDDNQPEVVNPCCACDEAKYEVTESSFNQLPTISIRKFEYNLIIKWLAQYEIVPGLN